ncbi:hypothetical protein ACFYQ5_19000 [Streptomyces sp. NPDC005794]|uniref:hypothetical protein n=1 Tax=Streptomyces sp. NPDC005794 TaxID=3364733 RepID=UPI0036A98C54
MAQLDTYPFDPYADSRWRFVPGLADASWTSFRTTTRPGTSGTPAMSCASIGSRPPWVRREDGPG